MSYPRQRRDARPDLRKAREAVLAAVDRACIARGEAQYLTGYRTGVMKHIAEEKDQELYRRSMTWFEQCAKAEEAVKRALAAYARAVRRGATRVR